LPTFLGLQLKTQADLGNNMGLSSLVRAAWKREWLSDLSTESSFITAPGFFFTVQGTQPARDALRISVAEQLKLDRNVSIFAGFNGDFAPSAQSYFGTLGMKVAW
jgi:outer membrane autotransporter protein